jgi:hypothetical protein
MQTSCVRIQASASDLRHCRSSLEPKIERVKPIFDTDMGPYYIRGNYCSIVLDLICIFHISSAVNGRLALWL